MLHLATTPLAVFAPRAAGRRSGLARATVRHQAGAFVRRGSVSVRGFADVFTGIEEEAIELLQAFRRKYHYRRQDGVTEDDPRYLDDDADPDLLEDTVIDLDLPPPLDQRDIGSCAANASSNALRHCLQSEGQQDFQPSRLFIYYNVRQAMGVPPGEDSGSDMRTLCQSIAKTHACDERTWPYTTTPDQQFKITPSRAAYNAAKAHAELQYFAVKQDICHIGKCLEDGFPILTGLTIYESFETDVGSDGMVQMPKPGEKEVGGHAVLMRGIDVPRKLVKFQNSWGPDWGDGGNFYVPFDYVLDPDLCDALWTFRFFK